MNERYDQVLRASYDALLGELHSAADTGRGLADLRARLWEQPAEALTWQPAVTVQAGAAAHPTGPPGSGTLYLTVAEAASIIRVSKMTIYRLVHAGELEAVRVGRSFRIPERALYAYLASEAAELRRPPQ